MNVKEFTSFDVAAVVRELKTEVIDSFVSNIYQLTAKTIVLKLHKTDKPPLWLVLEAGRRLNLTAYESEKPSTPSAFCMALRKHLRNSRLADIYQHEFERVVVILFKKQDDTLHIVLELFGGGNIILTDQNDRIIQALSYRRMRDRDVIRGQSFSFAPSSARNPFRVEAEEFMTGLKSFGNVEAVRAVARFLGIGGFYSEEILARAGIDKTRVVEQLTDSELCALYEIVKNLLLHVTAETLESHVVLDKTGSLVDVAPLRLKRYEKDFETQTFGTFNEALDEFYSRVSAVEDVAHETRVEDLKIEAERLERMIAEQEKVVASARAEAEQNRRIGDVIYSYFGDLQGLLERFQDRGGPKGFRTTVYEISRKKEKKIAPWVFFESFDSREFRIGVCVGGLVFSLDLRKTLFENAADFYEDSKRAKQRMEGARTALNDSLRRLGEKKTEIATSEALNQRKPGELIETLESRRLKHKEWFEKFRWFVSSDGFLIVAGKDAVSNEVLIKKHTETDDVIFHADILGAPFAVIKTKGKKPGEQCLREAGVFAAAFSRGWREGFASVDVYWVRPEQLSKGGPSGESVGHGAFVVRGERNWMRGVPLRIAIGTTFDEEAGIATVKGGPIEAVRAKANAYVVIVPGGIEGKELFKLILRNLAGKVSKELREAILNLSVESVREFVPFSKGMILKD